MAQNEETILLHFDIDEKPAVQSIKDLRTANTQLRAERDKVNISTKEGRELVDKLNVAIDKNNKVIKDNSSALEKQRQNVGNYSKSIQEAAGELNIMGTNVGGLTTKLASFANPATAAVAIVGALGAAYARSSIGAKDLEFASNQLSFATTILTDKFASLFSTAEDGQGFFSKLVDSLISAIDPSTSILSNLAANAQEELNAINEKSGLVQANVNERLAENAELMTEISNAETDLNNKRQIAQKIQDNLSDNAKERLELINQEIDQQKILAAATQDKGPIEGVINKLIAQRSSIITQEIKGREKVEKLLNAAINAEQKRLELERLKNEELESEFQRRKRIRDLEQSQKGASPLGGTEDPFGVDALAKQNIKITKKDVDAVTDAENKKREQYQKTADLQRLLADQQLATAAATAEAAATLAGIAGEQTEAFKAFAIISTTISTYATAQKAYEAAFLPVPTVASPALGAVYAGLAIANGLANIAQITGIAAAGGADFITKKPTMLLVGDNPGGRERVTVEPLSGKGQTRVFGGGAGVAMAGGGSLTVNDGGFVANSNLQQSQQAMIMANAFKNMPAPVVGVEEITRVQKRIAAKEKVTRQ